MGGIQIVLLQPHPDNLYIQLDLNYMQRGRGLARIFDIFSRIYSLLPYVPIDNNSYIALD